MNIHTNLGYKQLRSTVQGEGSCLSYKLYYTPEKGKTLETCLMLYHKSAII